jgi:hypothetical protein
MVVTTVSMMGAANVGQECRCGQTGSHQRRPIANERYPGLTERRLARDRLRTGMLRNTILRGREPTPPGVGET